RGSASRRRWSTFSGTRAPTTCPRVTCSSATGSGRGGKGLDGFLPLGPVVVEAGELPDPRDVAIRSRVNGELVQDASTREMVFSVAEIIALASEAITLEPGDVLLTGTPKGAGYFREPRFL